MASKWRQKGDKIVTGLRIDDNVCAPPAVFFVALSEIS